MFDLSGVKEQSGYELVPEGKFLCACTNAEIKETKDGTGQYIRAELTIKTGDYEGRKLWTNFNVKNRNDKATEIGLSQLKTFLKVANYSNPDKLNSVSELCGLIVGVKTKIKKDEQYGDKTEVSYFFDSSKIDSHTEAEPLPF